MASSSQSSMVSTQQTQQSSTQGSSSTIVSRTASTISGGWRSSWTASESGSQKTMTSQSAAPSTPKRESPGAWKHPRAREIAQRQRASTFGPDNIASITKCITVLLGIEVVRWTLTDFIWTVISPIHRHTGNTPLWLVRVLALGFLVFALKPLWLGPDQLLDIDLNATQRSLLGLDPNATPPVTPTTKYVTPPRYARSITPQTGTPGSRGSSPANSPLAHKDGSVYRQRSGSFTVTHSPSRQASQGSDPWGQSIGSSVYGTPSKDSSIFAPQTPSPSGKSSGIAFSNKWLYHKGLRSGSMSRASF